MDLLAIRPTPAGIECRQLEVQASLRPVSYISPIPKEIQRLTGGRAPFNAKARDIAELKQGVREWIEKKYNHPEERKVRENLRPALGPGSLSSTNSSIPRRCWRSRRKESSSFNFAKSFGN
jgi:hypothetical protein